MRFYNKNALIKHSTLSNHNPTKFWRFLRFGTLHDLFIPKYIEAVHLYWALRWIYTTEINEGIVDEATDYEF